MSTKREREAVDRVEDEGLDNESKRQRLDDDSSPSPPPVSIANPLSGLANNYADIDEEEDYVRRERGSVNERRNDGSQHNGHKYGEADDSDEEDDSREQFSGRNNRQVEVRKDCPYLDTVNRQVLDFDFEKFCSVSLSNLNVYACLVCGKYYQGRGKKSHAYTHSLEAGHHVYINLRTEKVYCLPDGYEINDPSLDDIRHVLNPRFTAKEVEQLDKNKQWSRALDGSSYLPGMVGLNNIKETDFVNVTIQSLMRVTPLRNFFLIPENYQHCKSPLVHRFGELTRKIWHARNFKGQVSPHEFLQAVMKASKKRFRIGAQSDPVEFMSWLLNTLHADLKTSKKNTSIIYECFQGELEVVKEIPNKVIADKKENNEDQNNGKKLSDGVNERYAFVKETSKMPFLMLGLDLPPPPLFKDVLEKNIIPQVPLFNILTKFDGETVTEVVRPHIARMQYRVTRLPKYMILHMRRFTKNNFFVEKNPTLVNFPVKNLELKDYIPLPAPKENEKLRSKYDLIANVVHDGKPGEGFYRVFVQRKSEELWYEMQDLHVSETLPHLVALSEAYMQIYEQQQ
ncbi:U4/U6.U5 tri-snRNP-associated protein 2 isoform X2 [Cajanus cajan]|uniref:U4/U6.U5 tri-snRNP-associated protein 2 n=2 Tax=Cajanus cajan TaxID=3821 RepID=A0A151RRU0_CAJCA|nr:U4/U6.U5 tri-snRNP-associated protein 2 isoform X2 [Cajanus cajan]XP_020236874.1 U4/U6.U5 tri-snRNP-associated protein 2 isoform X2 [Cajanus cajan]XP_020236875.1 U4/U6.U5 tri-snRNP-associated protein 2 isoform X2 [Cajanus cajan]XP_020236877.1 U4/U6.U5 tri-snRNP-associated protein 2 isoform X2 [Cajanus cajan]XP_020236878.1 U4/U6.U5 tri-snRNP-associated protein 2 isoform X2 [Cajanus cajan]XP_020236879.1 U4/U6.U5 tri-snRNP-associated protein 2 isoform X2 [Cajanus cajan]XP_020236881.1 U4/U6.U5